MNLDLLRDFDLMKVSPEDTEFTKEFILKAERDAALTCFVGYFDTFFDLPHSVNFSTSPLVPSTHWKQTIFYLPKLHLLKKGYFYYFIFYILCTCRAFYYYYYFNIIPIINYYLF